MPFAFKTRNKFYFILMDNKCYKGRNNKPFDNYIEISFLFFNLLFYYVQMFNLYENLFYFLWKKTFTF